jgi:hypothetical protein
MAHGGDVPFMVIHDMLQYHFPCIEILPGGMAILDYAR